MIWTLCVSWNTLKTVKYVAKEDSTQHFESQLI